MATDVVKTIATSGGDYTTVAAWEAAQQGDLVTADERRIGEITGTVTDSNQIVINGSTTDSTRYMMIRAASGEEFNGNPAGTFATLSCTYAGGGESFYVQDPYFRYQSLKITATGGKSVCVAQEANITIEKCWLYSSGSSGTAVYTGNSSATDLVLIATLISGWATSLQNPQAVTTNPLFINCILSTRPDAHNNGLTAYNTYAVDFYSSGSGTYAGDYNAADNTSSPGANSIHNITDTDEFRSPSTNDYRLLETDAGYSASQLLKAGTDKSTYLSLDVEGDTIQYWMIGFDYTTLDVIKTIATSGGDYSTVAAWESAQQGVLTTLDERRIGEITGTVSETNYTITGSTVDSTRYRILRAASGEEFNGNPAGSFATSTVTSSGLFCMTVTEQYFRYYGLKTTAPNQGAGAVAQYFNGDNQRIDRCWFTAASIAYSPLLMDCTNAQITRSSFTGAATKGPYQTAASKTGNLIINCVTDKACDCTTSGATTAYNTVASTFNGNMAGDYNAATDTTAPGANSIDNIVFVDEFQSPSTDDYRIKTSSQLLEAGTDKSAYLTTDVEGETITTWMIGFDYEVYVSASTDISATTDSLSITDYAASITQPINVSATTDSLAITDFAATVQADVDSNITATVDTLTITDYAASISLGKNIAATADSLTITDFAASVQADVDANITTTTDSLSITDFAASVQADIDSNISASVEALSITDYAATVQADVDTNVTATAGSLSITDFDTAVSVNTITRVNATTDNLSITDHDAQVEELVASLTAYQSVTFYISNGIPQRIFN